jgi:hypothetical protein
LHDAEAQQWPSLQRPPKHEAFDEHAAPAPTFGTHAPLGSQ